MDMDMDTEFHTLFADLLLICVVCGGNGNDHTLECMEMEAAYWAKVQGE